jgi:hypothetical protein
MALEIWRYIVLEQRDLSPLICWRLNTPECSNKCHTARHEGAGYAKLVVVPTCKGLVQEPRFGESGDRPSKKKTWLLQFGM